MATQNVTVKVIGTQKQIVSHKGNVYTVSTEAECTELTVPGTYSFTNGKHFLLYDEDHGEGHVTGNTVKIYDGVFEVIKKGASSAHMYFRAGQRDEGWYETPYGRFSMAIDVKTVDIIEGSDYVQVEATYIMELNGEPASRNRICILIDEIG